MDGRAGRVSENLQISISVSSGGLMEMMISCFSTCDDVDPLRYLEVHRGCDFGLQLPTEDP